jgi:N-acetylmuramoyl-L-alanine amidase
MMKISKSYIKYLLIFALVALSLSVNADGIKKYKLRKVVIDAGHGGKDPGAPGKYSWEKNIVLAIALKLGNYIETNMPDVEVIYTRKKDVFVELDRRAAIAIENKADLFISIHCNANESKVFYGSCTYVMGLNKADDNLEVAKQENSVILVEDNYRTRYEGYDPNSPESYIMFSLVRNTFLEQSMVFGAKIQEQLRSRAGRDDKGVKQAGLVVLWKTTMPAVLVETAYISNPAEEKFLNSQKGQTLIASSIYRAFKDYKSMIESRSDINIADEEDVTDKTLASDQKNGKTAVSETLVVKSENGGKNAKVQKEKLPAKNSKTTKVMDKKSEITLNPATSEKDIRFKVQIVISKEKLPADNKKFKGMEGIEEIKIDGLYKYFVGNTVDTKEIFKVQLEARKKFPDAFIVAFKNGQKIPYNIAVKELKQ